MNTTPQTFHWRFVENAMSFRWYSLYISQVNGSQCPLKLPPSWITEEASSPISCHTRCNDLMLDRLLITAGNGQLKLEANFEVINETSQDFVIDVSSENDSNL